MKTRMTDQRLGEHARYCAAVARWALRQRERIERAKQPGLSYGELREYVAGLLVLERAGERLAAALAEALRKRTGGGSEPPAAA